MKDFTLHQYTERAELLLDQAKKTFSDLHISADDLPQNMRPAEGAIKLVFVGQYSSGKSSIIKMLSGIDTDIGAAITTQEAKSYDWNGMEIIDTPGIHTKLRPDHDAIAYDEISHAALLVFVVTNEGFSDDIGKHFRKLAIEQKRASNMVLVVNKMDRTEGGNSTAQQQILLPDIRQVIEPYKPEDLYLSFLSTQSYEESLAEKDEKIRQELLEESGRATFIKNLNDFVRAKKVTSRLQRPLYTLKDSLEKALGTSANIDAKTLDSTEELAKRLLRILDNAETDCMDKIEDLAQNCQIEIKKAGREAARFLDEARSEEDVKEALDVAVEKAQKSTDVCQKAITEAIKDMTDKITKETKKEMDSPFAQEVIELENRPLDLSDTTFKNNLACIKREEGLDADTAFGMTGTTLSWGATQTGLAEISGSLLNDGIKKLGKTLGIEIAQLGGTFAKFLNGAFAVGGVLFALYTLYTSEEKQRKNAQELNAAKNKIREKFTDEANATYENLLKVARKTIQELLKKGRTPLNEKLQEVKELRSLQEMRKEKLSSLLDAGEQLMKEIEAAMS